MTTKPKSMKGSSPLSVILKNNIGIISPATFAIIASGRKWVLAPHLDLINSHLIDPSVKRLMVFLPPRHGKSSLLSQYYPAWYLGTFPDKKIILTSYEADFAASWGRKTRDILEAYGHLFPNGGVKIRQDSAAASRWEITGNAGSMVTAGVGGPITGKGADCILIDDPVKNAEQAASRVYREKTWEWYKSTLYTRLEPGGRIILIMTRWHEDDLAGRLIEEMNNGTGERWHIISFPAIADRHDVLGRAPGEALWSSRFPLETLETIRETLGSYWWSSLYMQRPAPPGGALFKRVWFEIIRSAPGNIDMSVRFWDLAASESEKADYTAGLLLGEASGVYYVMDVQHERMAPAGVEDLVRQTAETDGYEVDIIMEQEPGSGGVNTINQYARRVLKGFVFRGVRSSGTKTERARGVAAAAERGDVKLVKGSWNKAFLDELSSFPHGEHDDIVDALSGAFNALASESRGDVATLDEAVGRRTEVPGYGDADNVSFGGNGDEIPGMW